MYSVLLAIHLPDGVLADRWWIGGFGIMAAMLLFGAWGIRDEEIPRTALMTAAFFVASLIHVPLPGSSVHLLLNGLLGAVLGRRAALAIPIGLFLQMALFQHGGWTTLGINSVIMGLPALLAWVMFAGLRRAPWARRPWFRGLLVAGGVSVTLLGLAYAVTLFATNRLGGDTLETDRANAVAFHPGTLVAAAVVSVLAAFAERRLENAPEFPVGFVVGVTAVLATVLLNSLALLAGGTNRAGMRTPALLLCVIHLPLAVIEGTVLGFLVGFLARVKPEMLGWPSLEKPACTVDVLP
jgi:cobalt/nickel transport system permease protein